MPVQEHGPMQEMKLKGAAEGRVERSVDELQMVELAAISLASPS